MTDFELSEGHHAELLVQAAEALDRCEEARAILDEKGITCDDRYGVPKLRPEVSVERDQRLAFARVLRELALDAAIEEAARPPLIAGGRRYGRRAG
jgi:hypothetical protein